MKLKIIFGPLLLFCLYLLVPISAQAVTVGPVKLEYSLNPGDVVQGEIYLKNEEADTKTFYPSIEGFTEQNGNKSFIKGNNLLQNWFKIDSGIVLKSGEDRKIPFTLSIPKDAPPGGQFGVWWWGTDRPGASGTEQVSVQTRAGILVYINISGDIQNTAEISAFRMGAGKSISWGGPVDFNIKVSNTGNVYIKPQGNLKVTSIFGTTKANLPINYKEYQILPKSYRELGDMEWIPGTFSLGPYKAVANVVYGEKGESVSVSKWIWVLPIKTIALIIGIIIVLILFFRWYNHMLMRRYKGLS